MTRLLSAASVLLLTISFLAAGGGKTEEGSNPDVAGPGTAPETTNPASPGDTQSPPAAPEKKAAPPPEVQKEIEQSRAAEAKASALREAAVAHPEDVRYQVEWLQGLFDLGRVDEALSLAPDIVERFPHSADLAVIYGRLLLRDGQFDLAGLQFQRALSLGDSARTRSLAARTAFLKGDLKGAEADLHKAIALDPNLEEAHQMLSLLYERTGRYSEAAGEMKASSLGERKALLKGFAKEPPMALPATFSPVTVPFVAPRGYPPAIKIQIGDGIEKLFVIDTGSEDVSLTVDAARLLGLPDGKGSSKDAEGPKPADTAPAPSYSILPRVTIGDLVIKRVPVWIIPGLRYPDDQIAGAVGRSFLRRFRVVLDYPARTVTLSSASGTPLEGVTFNLASVILLDGFNGNKPVGKFVLDTSSYTPGALDVQFVAEETGLTIFSQEVKKIPSGPYLFKFTMPSLTVGGVEFLKFPATAVDLRRLSRQIGVNVRGVIGNSLLRQCRLEIDFKNQRLSLRKVAAAEPPPPAADSLPPAATQPPTEPGA